MRQRTITGSRAAALLLAIVAVCALANDAPGQSGNRRMARPDNAVTSESLARETRNPAVRRLQRLYADTGATTEQLARLREIDARAFAMRRFATAEDLAILRAERAAVLTPEQLEKVSRAATSNFRRRLAQRTPADDPSTATLPEDAGTTATATADAPTTATDDGATTATDSADGGTTATEDDATTATADGDRATTTTDGDTTGTTPAAAAARD